MVTTLALPHIGDRDEVAARELWSSLPPVYRQCAVAYTDFWAAYSMVLVNGIERRGKAPDRRKTTRTHSRSRQRNRKNKLYREI